MLHLYKEHRRRLGYPVAYRIERLIAGCGDPSIALSRQISRPCFYASMYRMNEYTYTPGLFGCVYRSTRKELYESYLSSCLEPGQELLRRRLRERKLPQQEAVGSPGTVDHQAHHAGHEPGRSRAVRVSCFSICRNRQGHRRRWYIKW